jgi:hypothetical protein
VRLALVVLLGACGPEAPPGGDAGPPAGAVCWPPGELGPRCACDGGRVGLVVCTRAGRAECACPSGR